MNESNKNDPIFRSNSNIMTSTDWNFIGGQSNKNETYFSSLTNDPQNELSCNKHNCARTQCYRKASPARDIEQQAYKRLNRSTNLMLNGVETSYETLSKIDREQETRARENHRNDTYRSIERLLEATRSISKKQPAERLNKLSELPPSLSSSHPVTNVTATTKLSNVSNFKNYSLSSPISRSPYHDRAYSLTDSYRDKLLSNSHKKHIHMPTCYLNNSPYSNDSAKRKYSILLPTTPTDPRRTSRTYKDHQPQYSPLHFDHQQLTPSALRNSNDSQAASTPISLKKLNLSLPLKSEKSVMDKKFSFDFSQIPQSRNSVDHSNANNNESNDKKFSDKRFSQNQPNRSSLATVQTYNGNRSHTPPQHHPVQCAKTTTIDTIADLSIRSRSNPRKESSVFLRDELRVNGDDTAIKAQLPVNKIEQHQPSKTNSFSEANTLKSQLNEQTLEQISKQVSDKLSNQITSQLSNKLSSELSNQIKSQVLNSHDILYTDLSKLNTDLLKLNDDLNCLNDNLLKSDKNDSLSKSHKLNNNDQQQPQTTSLLDTISRTLNEKESSEPKLSRASFIDYNVINLKLNSRLVHLVKHSEVDQKSSGLLLNLVSEDHCGIILCVGQSTLTDAQYSIGYYIGAITHNSTAEHLFAIGDLVLEIDSRPLQWNSFMNLEKVTNLMNHQFNLNRYLQLRIVPRTVLMSQFKKKDDYQSNDAIRTVVINAQKRKLIGKQQSFGLTIKGGKEYGLGIFVSNVDKDSLSERSGLKAGDLIITLNGHDFLNLSHDHAAFLIRNTTLLILRVRNVGFVPISALPLDQNDETTKFRCNSAIEMTDYDRTKMRSKVGRLTSRLNRIPIQTIKDELKSSGLSNKNEIKKYLVKKYGMDGRRDDALFRNDALLMSGKQISNYLARSSNTMNNSDGRAYGQKQLNTPFAYSKTNNYRNIYPSSLVPNQMPSSLHSISNHLLNDNLSSTMPLHSSLSNVVSPYAPFPASNCLSTALPPTNSREASVLIDKFSENLNGGYSLEEELEREAQLDNQLDLLLGESDKQTFNFYKNEFQMGNISLNTFAHSICRLLDTVEKQNLFAYLKPFIPKSDLKHFDQLISIYNRQNYLLNDDEFAFNDNRLYRSSSYDDQLMDREHWVNTSSFNQNPNLDNFLIQRDLNSSFGRHQPYLSNRYNSFPSLNQNFYLSGSQFEPMSPYHHYNQQQQQSTDLQINGIQTTNSPITSSTSSLSPYLSAALETRPGDCTTTTAASHRRNLISDQNCLNNHSVHSSNNRNFSNLHPIDANISNANYFHPSALNSNLHSVNRNALQASLNRNVHNQGNFVDFNEENQLLPELRNQINYQQHQDLLSTSNHAMVRRHRSLPAGSFQRELNLYPLNKHHLSDQAHQRSASFKLPPRRAHDNSDCFRVRVRKSRPILGIAIEGGINVPNQTLPRIISIHETGSARECGELKVGHIILEINGVPTEGLTHSEVARLLAHSYYTNQDNFIELVIKEKESHTDAMVRGNSLLMLNNNYE